MVQVRTAVQIQMIGGVPHVEGRFIPPFMSSSVVLPDQQVIALAQEVVRVAQQNYPNNRGGIMRMGTGVQQAHRYNLSITHRDLATFPYQRLVDNAEKMVDSDDAILVRDVVLLLAVM
jgi:hypothetical protein